MNLLLLVACLVAVIAAAPASGGRFEDPCGTPPPEATYREVGAPAHLDICAFSVAGTRTGSQLVLELGLEVDGDLEGRTSTTHRVGWTNPNGCVQYVEVRDAPPVPDASAAVFRFGCESDQMASSSSLSPDTCVGAAPEGADCIGDAGSVVAVPDDAVTVEGGAMTVRLDVTALLGESASALFATGTELTDLHAASYLRAGPHRQDNGRGTTCIVGSCVQIQPGSDAATTNQVYVIP